MTQLLRALVAFTEDLCLILSTYMVSHDHQQLPGLIQWCTFGHIKL